jgi:hypothetical protein
MNAPIIWIIHDLTIKTKNYDPSARVKIIFKFLMINQDYCAKAQINTTILSHVVKNTHQF